MSLPHYRPLNQAMYQRNHKVGEENMAFIDEEVHKLTCDYFIKEVRYPSWLANVVLMRNASNNWHMCVDFVDLNATYPTDLHPLPNRDHLSEGSSGYKTFIFLDSYSGYNQIKMDPIDVSKMTFMSNHVKYYYNTVPFGLMNVGATY